MSLFVAKYSTYTKTKAIRIPEELADLVLELTHALDSYNETTKDGIFYVTPEDILKNLINKLKILNKSTSDSFIIQ